MAVAASILYKVTASCYSKKEELLWISWGTDFYRVPGFCLKIHGKRFAAYRWHLGRVPVRDIFFAKDVVR